MPTGNKNDHRLNPVENWSIAKRKLRSSRKLNRSNITEPMLLFFLTRAETQKLARTPRKKIGQVFYSIMVLFFLFCFFEQKKCRGFLFRTLSSSSLPENLGRAISEPETWRRTMLFVCATLFIKSTQIFTSHVTKLDVNFVYGYTLCLAAMFY